MAGKPIRSNNRHHIWIMWLVALVWTAVCVLLWNKLRESGQLSDLETGQLLLVGLFFSADVFIVGMTAHATWGLLRFGRSLLTLDPDPGSIGGHVGGTIELAHSFQAGLPFIIQLNCIHSRITKSGKRRSRSESVLWQADDFFTVQGANHLSFVFEVPPGLPPADPKRSGDYHLWRVEVSAELDGADFHRSFDIPVKQSEPRLSAIKQASTQSAASLDATLAGIENIANIRQIPDGIEAEFPALGRPAQGIFLILFGMFFSGAGMAVLLGGANGFIGSIFALLGLPFIGGGLYYIGKSLRVSISPGGVKNRRFLFGYPLSTKAMSAREIERLEISNAGSLKSGHRTRTYYTIVAKSRTGKKLVVAERLEGRREAEFLLESYLTYLGRVSPGPRASMDK